MTHILEIAADELHKTIAEMSGSGELDGQLSISYANYTRAMDIVNFIENRIISIFSEGARNNDKIKN